MTKEAAIHSFWSSFGIPAYNESSVPSGENAPDFPYITYQMSTDSFGAPVPMTASVWYLSSSWLGVIEKTNEISRAIGRGGKIVPCDGGGVWIKKDSTFSQSMGDQEDSKIRRKVLSISAEFLTQD